MCLVTGNAGFPCRGRSAQTNVPVTGALQSWVSSPPFIKCVNPEVHGSWKIRMGGMTCGHGLLRFMDPGACLCEKSDLRSVYFENGPSAKAAALQRVRSAQPPLYPQWPRQKSIRQRQYRNASRTCHDEIPPRQRTVSGMPALVTAPLCLPVTRAASLRSSQRTGPGPPSCLAIRRPHMPAVRIRLTLEARRQDLRTPGTASMTVRRRAGHKEPRYPTTRNRSSCPACHQPGTGHVRKQITAVYCSA